MPTLKVAAGLIGFWVLMVCGTASAKTVLINEDAQALGGELEYFEDEAGQFKAVELLNNPSAFKFSPVQGDVPNFGFSSSVFWFRVNLQNTTQESQFVLDISYPLLDLVTFYRGTFSKSVYLGEIDQIVKEIYSGNKANCRLTKNEKNGILTKNEIK